MMENFKISKESSNDNGKKSIDIIIEGDLSLQNSKKLKTQIEKEIKAANTVNLIAKNITQADITFVQIIESLKKQLKDKISIEVEYPYDIKTLMHNAGFA